MSEQPEPQANEVSAAKGRFRDRIVSLQRDRQELAKIIEQKRAELAKLEQEETVLRGRLQESAHALAEDSGIESDDWRLDADRMVFLI